MEPKIDLQAYLNRKNMNQAELTDDELERRIKKILLKILVK